MNDVTVGNALLGGAEIALVTYSTKPRGGVVHTLSLAEALQRAGLRVHIVTLGEPGSGFFRPTSVPFTVVPAPPRGTSLEQRVFASVDALEGGLAALADRFALRNCGTRIATSPTVTLVAPFSRPERKRRKFIGGEPMKSATYIEAGRL